MAKKDRKNDKSKEDSDEINIAIRLKGGLARDCQKLLDDKDGYYGSVSELARDALRRLVESYNERERSS